MEQEAQGASSIFLCVAFDEHDQKRVRVLPYSLLEVTRGTVVKAAEYAGRRIASSRNRRNGVRQTGCCCSPQRSSRKAVAINEGNNMPRLVQAYVMSRRSSG